MYCNSDITLFPTVFMSLSCLLRSSSFFDPLPCSYVFCFLRFLWAIVLFFFCIFFVEAFSFSQILCFCFLFYLCFGFRPFTTVSRKAAASVLSLSSSFPPPPPCSRRRPLPFPLSSLFLVLQHSQTKSFIFQSEPQSSSQSEGSKTTPPERKRRIVHGFWGQQSPRLIIKTFFFQWFPLCKATVSTWANQGGN